MRIDNMLGESYAHPNKTPTSHKITFIKIEKSGLQAMRFKFNTFKSSTNSLSITYEWFLW